MIQINEGRPSTFLQVADKIGPINEYGDSLHPWSPQAKSRQLLDGS
jgi:hypothetical protein